MEKHIKQKQVKERYIAPEIKDGKITLESMTEGKEEQAEKTEQKEGIENLRGFWCSVVTHLPISFISVVKRKKWLNYTRDPEKGNKPGNEHEHLPFPDISPGKMAFCKNDTDNQKYNRLHQLKKLQTWNIINKF